MNFIFRSVLAVLFFAACADAVGQDNWWATKKIEGATYLQEGDGIRVDEFPVYHNSVLIEDKDAVVLNYAEGQIINGSCSFIFDVNAYDIVFAHLYDENPDYNKGTYNYSGFFSSKEGEKREVFYCEDREGKVFVYRAEKTEELCVRLSYTGSYADEIGNENYKANMSIMRYGSLKSFELKPTTGETMSNYVKRKEKDFKSMDEKAIISTLRDDILCYVTDSYGNVVVNACEYMSWQIDKERGVAHFTAYFAPLSLWGTVLVWGDLEKQESDISWYDSKGFGSGSNYTQIKLWDASSQTSVANVFDNDDVDVTVDGHTILSASGRKTYVYSLSGALVGIADDGQMNVPEGMYIVKQGFQTKKVTVKP